jgi:hypothetical protein
MRQFLPITGIGNLLVLIERIPQMLNFLKFDVFQPKPLHIEKAPETAKRIVP